MHKNIVVVGMGYVGLSNALFLAHSNNVIGIDIDNLKIKKLQNKKMPFTDNLAYDVLKTSKIKFSTNLIKHIKNADYIFLATPTDFNPQTNYFNTASLDFCIKQIFDNQFNGQIVIKSTVPIGYCSSNNKKYNTDSILFSPEFSREGKSYFDVVFPDRIIVGSAKNNTKFAKNVLELLKENTKNADAQTFITQNSEAESIKLFSNTYLAMRVAFFNEIDTFAKHNNLSVLDIIKGVGMDKRIGNFYNNPSFGYGGYCLPKDSKQIRASFKDIDSPIMHSIVESNYSRKKFIAQDILNKKNTTVGIYRLIMKSDSDNFRNSAILDIIKMLIKGKQKVILYEPLLDKTEFIGANIVNNFEEFKAQSDIIVANRMDKNLKDVKNKIYTSAIFNRD
jgi:UDPglucose 6-dehydrogenase